MITSSSSVGGAAGGNSKRVTRWVTLAVASGAFAALNGLFAKLYLFEPPFPFPLLLLLTID